MRQKAQKSVFFPLWLLLPPQKYLLSFIGRKIKTKQKYEKYYFIFSPPLKSFEVLSVFNFFIMQIFIFIFFRLLQEKLKKHLMNFNASQNLLTNKKINMREL